jgi:hypothetical protein
MKLRLLFLGLWIAGALSAQNEQKQDSTAKALAKRKNELRFYEQFDPKPWVNTITAVDLTELVTTLASKEMQGRETGEKGQRLAADYIAGQFKSAGMPPMASSKSPSEKNPGKISG